MNPYSKFVTDFANLLEHGRTLPLGTIAPQENPAVPANAPAVLVFSPHPDDECIVGGLALRLMREERMRAVNVAVTLGSNPARKQGRRIELTNACKWIGFDLEFTAPDGLDKINAKNRAQSPEHWAAAVERTAEIIRRYSPRAVFLPHEQDANSTHVGTHFLVMDALKSLPSNFQVFVVETEFWAPLAAPNLMVELSGKDLADLLAALSFHVEEVRRNPYHLGLPSWMRDNVRRGAELVGGQGGAAPDFTFATLYRLRQWKEGRLQDVWSGGRQFGQKDSLSTLFANSEIQSQ